MKKAYVYIIAGGLAIISISITIALIVHYGHYGIQDEKVDHPQYFSLHSPISAGVASNGYECAKIGRSILLKGGSAVDAALATVLCDGVARPESLGIGGGFLMTIYIKKTNSAITLNARERAPRAASENMFKEKQNGSFKGGLAIAIPGELRGYEYAHKRFGKLPWTEIIRPSIELCRKGHLVTANLEKVLKSFEQKLMASPTLKEVFIEPKTNSTYRKGSYIKRLKLAETLEIIAEEGADALYNGRLTKDFVNDIASVGGIITEKDLKEYRPIWQESIVSKLPFNQTLYTIPLPGSGVILTFILNVLKDDLDLSHIDNPINWQRIVEVFKYAYAKRTQLGDPDFVSGMEKLVINLTSSDYAAIIRNHIKDTATSILPEYYGANISFAGDGGTGNVAVIAPNGDAVCVTSTINLHFGAEIRSQSTGIILNNQMDDFSSPSFKNSYGIPPSPSNFIAPYKHPMSSMCPSIVVDKNNKPILVIGAAGGSRITTSVAQVAIRYLWFNQTLEKSVNASRLHHQLVPMNLFVEEGFNTDVIKELSRIGHNITVSSDSDGFVAVTAMSMLNQHTVGSSDPRRGGQVAILNP